MLYVYITFPCGHILVYIQSMCLGSNAVHFVALQIFGPTHTHTLNCVHICTCTCIIIHVPNVCVHTACHVFTCWHKWRLISHTLIFSPPLFLPPLFLFSLSLSLSLIQVLNGPSMFDGDPNDPDDLGDPSLDDYGDYDGNEDGDDVMFPSLMELSPTGNTKYQSHTLHCSADGEFGFTLRHFSIQPNTRAVSKTLLISHKKQ